MSGHTPGPWKVFEFANYQGDPDLVGAWIGTDDLLVAEARGAAVIGGFRHEEHTANACLIAAAPDLLEALKALLGHDERDAGCVPSDAHLDAQNDARAAIAQAVGGEA